MYYDSLSGWYKVHKMRVSLRSQVWLVAVQCSNVIVTVRAKRVDYYCPPVNLQFSHLSWENLYWCIETFRWIMDIAGLEWHYAAFQEFQEIISGKSGYM